MRSNILFLISELPVLLRTLVEGLVRTKVKTNQKVIALSHALMAAARPGSLL